MTIRDTLPVAELLGRHQLTDWLRRRGLSQGDAAKEIGIHRVHLNQFLTGERRPGLDTAILLEERTGIPVRAWRRSRPLQERKRSGLHNHSKVDTVGHKTAEISK